MNVSLRSALKKEGGLHDQIPENRSLDCFTAAHDLQLLMFSSIAHKLENDPKLLKVPLCNIERWVAGEHPDVKQFLVWQEMIERAQRCSEAFSGLLSMLRDSSPSAMRLKGFSPFAGVLSHSELDSLSGWS